MRNASGKITTARKIVKIQTDLGERFTKIEPLIQYLTYCLSEANEAIDQAFKSRFKCEMTSPTVCTGSLFFQNRKKLQKLAEKLLLEQVPILRQNHECWKMMFEYDAKNPLIIWALGLKILPRFPDFEWLGEGDFVTITPIEDKRRRRKSREHDWKLTQE
jgi:hypothetical protein